jgi:hypothetical protein
MPALILWRGGRGQKHRRRLPPDGRQHVTHACKSLIFQGNLQQQDLATHPEPGGPGFT